MVDKAHRLKLSPGWYLNNCGCAGTSSFYSSSSSSSSSCSSSFPEQRRGVRQSEATQSSSAPCGSFPSSFRARVRGGGYAVPPAHYRGSASYDSSSCVTCTRTPGRAHPAENAFDEEMADRVMRGSVKMLADQGWDGVKFDSCSQMRNLSKWAELINETGRPVLIENCFQGGFTPGTLALTLPRLGGTPPSPNLTHRPPGDTPGDSPGEP